MAGFGHFYDNAFQSSLWISMDMIERKIFRIFDVMYILYINSCRQNNEQIPALTTTQVIWKIPWIHSEAFKQSVLITKWIILQLFHNISFWHYFMVT